MIGLTYTQRGGPGVASYHFEAPSNCFISYEAAPPSWRLDNGLRLPAHKPFENPDYDGATLVFTGTINWREATFHGDSRWEYEMHFSNDLSTISGGQMRAFDAAGDATRTYEFGRNLQYSLHSGSFVPVIRRVSCR